MDEPEELDLKGLKDERGDVEGALLDGGDARAGDCDCEGAEGNPHGSTCEAVLMPSVELCMRPAPKHGATLHEQINDGSGTRATRKPLCHEHFVALQGNTVFADQS